MASTSVPRPAPAAPPRPPELALHAAPAALDSATLLRGGKSVTICHNGELYRLQATRQGKLILTK
jgi:hemin uptake protein HemP